MVVVSDAELLELYDANRSELFPALRRKGALAPLVVLLAVLPPLIAMVNDRIDSTDARWGLESLGLLSSSPTTGAGENEAVSWSAAKQKPLAAILTELALQMPGLSPPVALTLVSFICAVAVVMLWHSLCRNLAGPRFAFWSTALLACHGPLLIHVQSPAPTLLGLALALAALAGLFAHIGDAEGIVSGRLLFAGISLGLCLLVSGLAAATVVIIGVLLALATHMDAIRLGTSNGVEARSQHRGRWTVMRSVIVLAITAFAVGGWWVMMSATNQGATFWATWLDFERLPEFEGGLSNELSFASFTWFRLVDLMRMLLIPALFGVWCLGRALWLRSDSARRISIQFLAAWLIVSLIIWFAWLRRRPATTDVPDLLLMLPLVASAAFAIEQIALRRYRPVVAVWLVCLAFIVPLWTNAAREMPVGHLLQGEWAALLSGVSYFVACGILTAWLLIHARRHDNRQRYCLIGLLLLLVASNAIQGLQSVRSSAEDRRLELVLTEFHKSLLRHPGVEAQILVTDRSAPPDVEFIVRTARPGLALERMPDWNNGIARAAELMSESKRNVLIVDWRTIDGRSTKPLEDKLDIDSQFKPTMIHGRRLAAYLLTRRIQPP